MMTHKALTRDESFSLMTRVAEGDQLAIRQVYKEHAPIVWHVIRRYVNDEDSAREVMQDVFVEVWRSARNFDRRKASVATWITRIARTRAIDRLRRERASVRWSGHRDKCIDTITEMPDNSVDSDMDVVGERADTARILRAAIANLPDHQRPLLEMAFLHGYSHSELANKTGISEGTIKTRLFRALSTLRVELEKTGLVMELRS